MRAREVDERVSSNVESLDHHMTEPVSRELESSPLQPVALVGMHRSGTSMVAKVLHRAGLNLGPESALMPPAEENPEGFFEHLEFVRLNDEILNAAGAGWDCPPASNFDWESSELDWLRERARALADTLSDRVPWGWKDPRTTLSLPFWESVLGPLSVIAVVRNPLEVVTSLHRRNGFSVALSLTLWRIYAERLLQFTAPVSRLVTHYDAYFTRPDQEIDRITAFIGLATSANGDQGTAPVRPVPELRHHRKTLLDLQEADFPRDVISLYLQLCREADWNESGNANAWPDSSTDDRDQERPGSSVALGYGRTDLIRVENEALRRNNEDFTRALNERETRIFELEAALRIHETTRSELEGILRERDGRIYERNTIIQRRDHRIAALQTEIADLASERDRLRTDVLDLTDQLAASGRALESSAIHERALREQNVSLHQAQLNRDAEIMGTLGSVLSRHSVGAPASIYHRRLVEHIRQRVDATLPVGARVLVATYGDQAMLELGDTLTQSFPRSVPGVSADYTDISDDDAIGQLKALVAAGAEYLVVPSPALAWLANHPDLSRHLADNHREVVDERGVVTIYALSNQRVPAPASGRADRREH